MIGLKICLGEPGLVDFSKIVFVILSVSKTYLAGLTIGSRGQLFLLSW